MKAASNEVSVVYGSGIGVLKSQHPARMGGMKMPSMAF